MKSAAHLLALFVGIGPLQADAQEPPDPLCAPLQAFVNSVPPDQKRELIFHTIWGGNFKDSPEEALYAKRCDHRAYAPAQAVCDFLIKHGAVESSGHNAERALTCLSPGTHFAQRIDMQQGAFSFSFGSQERSSKVEVVFKEDAEIGGMTLRIVAEGY